MCRRLDASLLPQIVLLELEVGDQLPHILQLVLVDVCRRRICFVEARLIVDERRRLPQLAGPFKDCVEVR